MCILNLYLIFSSRWPHFDAPLVILFVVEEGPLGFLVVAIISFSIGLCIFAFASNQVRTSFLSCAGCINVRPQSRATLIATIVITSICAIGLIIVLLGSIPECFRRRVHTKREHYWRNLPRRKVRAAMYKLVPCTHDERNEAEKGSLQKRPENGEFLDCGILICILKSAKLSFRE